MLIAAIFWYIIPPMYYVFPFIIFFSVLFQEVFRGLFFLLYAYLLVLLGVRILTLPSSLSHPKQNRKWNAARDRKASISLQSSRVCLWYALFFLLFWGLSLRSSPRILVSGFGFGTMSSLLAFISALAESTGPGYLPCPACPAVSTFFIYAVTTLLFNALHIIWMIVAMDAYAKRSWFRVAAVALHHLAMSYVVRFH